MDLPDLTAIRSTFDPLFILIRVGFLVSGSISITFETWIGFSYWIFCPGVVPCFLMWRVTMFTPSTTTVCLSGNAFKTFPSNGIRCSTPSLVVFVWKRFFPAMTRTRSQEWIFIWKDYKTSGALEIIDLKRLFPRNSRNTGPKIRVPRGLPFSSVITQALSSERIVEPSALFTGRLVRTTTANTLSCFLTWPSGFAVLTEHLIISHIRAYRWREPPSIQKQDTSCAHELSATVNRVSFWIINKN